MAFLKPIWFSNSKNVQNRSMFRTFFPTSKRNRHRKPLQSPVATYQYKATKNRDSCTNVLLQLKKIYLGWKKSLKSWKFHNDAYIFFQFPPLFFMPLYFPVGFLIQVKGLSHSVWNTNCRPEIFKVTSVSPRPSLHLGILAVVIKELPYFLPRYLYATWQMVSLCFFFLFFFYRSVVFISHVRFVGNPPPGALCISHNS